MATTAEKTSLGLPQWNSGDKPDLKDFNEAFQTVDAELGKKADKGATQQWTPVFKAGETIFNPTDVNAVYINQDTFGAVSVYWNSTGPIPSGFISITGLPISARLQSAAPVFTSAPATIFVRIVGDELQLYRDGGVRVTSDDGPLDDSRFTLFFVKA